MLQHSVLCSSVGKRVLLAFSEFLFHFMNAVYVFRESLSLFIDPSRTAGLLACVAAILLVYVDNALIYQ